MQEYMEIMSYWFLIAQGVAVVLVYMYSNSTIFECKVLNKVSEVVCYVMVSIPVGFLVIYLLLLFYPIDLTIHVTPL